MTNEQVANMFTGLFHSGRSNSMFIDGDTIYSYGYHFPIATRVNSKLYLFNCNHYSNTTAKHKNEVLSAIATNDAQVIECDMVGDSYNKKLVVSIGYLQSKIDECLVKKQRAKSDRMVEFWQEQANEYTTQKKLAQSI